jgi:hypothetical protein
MEEPPGDATWKEEAVGACRGCGHTLCATTPRCGLPATVFLWSVATWTDATFMLVLGPDWMVGGLFCNNPGVTSLLSTMIKAE